MILQIHTRSFRFSLVWYIFHWLAIIADTVQTVQELVGWLVGWFSSFEGALEHPLFVRTKEGGSSHFLMEA